MANHNEMTALLVSRDLGDLAVCSTRNAGACSLTILDDGEA